MQIRRPPSTTHGEPTLRFLLYTEKTPAQALTAINARMQAKESASRASLGGWVEKNGAFALSVSTPVIGRFHRRTVMRGKIERENGVTTVRGDVPSGVDKQGQIVVFVALGLLAVLLLTSGNAVPALAVIPLGAYLYIPMTGDHTNCDLLMGELQRTLKAKEKPPKKSSETRAAGAAKAVSAKPAVPRTATTRSSNGSTTAARSTSTTRKTGTAATSSKAASSQQKPMSW